MDPMKVIMAPLRVRGIPNVPTIFMAGSIDMGSARNWQKDFEREMQHFPCWLYNPRRDDWDSSWKQTDSDPQFRTQVEWELDFLKYSNYVFMFISAESKAPITLLEFGMVSAAYPDKLIICVEDGFYRRGNIEVVCRRQGIPLFSDFKTAVEHLKIKVASKL